MWGLTTSRLVGAVSAGLCVISLGLADDGPGWRLRFDVAVVNPQGDGTRIEAGGGSSRVSIDSGVGAGFRGEYQFTERLGVELGVIGTASVDISTSTDPGNAIDSVEVSTFTPFTFGLNVHLTPGARPDLYIGPQVAIVAYSGVDVIDAPGGTSSRVSVDNDFGLGASIGLDLPLGQRGWMIQFNLRYIDTSISGQEGGERVDVDYDPMIAAVGFGYRF